MSSDAKQLGVSQFHHQKKLASDLFTSAQGQRARTTLTLLKVV